MNSHLLIQEVANYKPKHIRAGADHGRVVYLNLLCLQVSGNEVIVKSRGDPDDTDAYHVQEVVAIVLYQFEGVWFNITLDGIAQEDVWTSAFSFVAAISDGDVFEFEVQLLVLFVIEEIS